MSREIFQIEFLESRRLLSAAYEIIDLGTLGGDESSARDVNNLGQVVGAASAKDGNFHAFVWSPCDGMRDLKVPSLDDASATAINDRGQIVGTANYDAGFVAEQAFVYSVGKVQFLSRPRDPDNNIAVDINNRGEIVTYETHIAGNESGSVILYDTSLRPSLVARGTPHAINNSGIIAGTQDNDLNQVTPEFASRFIHGIDLND